MQSSGPEVLRILWLLCYSWLPQQFHDADQSVILLLRTTLNTQNEAVEVLECKNMYKKIPHYSWLYSEYGGEVWLLDTKLWTEIRMVKFDYLRCFPVISKNEMRNEIWWYYLQMRTCNVHAHTHTPKSRHTLWIFLSFLS